MKIVSVRTIVLAVPIASPVQTSFGVMSQRTAVLVELTASDGTSGWGESWCNFPSWAAQERLATINEGLAPQLLGKDPREIGRLNEMLKSTTRLLASQWGAPGPVAQAISAIDMGLWDLAGKAMGQPLFRLWGGTAQRIPVYASGLGPVDPHLLALELKGQGVKAFKLKVGFGAQRDEANLALMREHLGADVRLFVDANQAWDVATAEKMAGVLRRFDVAWLEEPLVADDLAGLAHLRRSIDIPIAAGENTYGLTGFMKLVASDCVDILQPDVTKSGGLSESLRICNLALAYGIPYAPHYLGNAVGLLASLHLFASVPGGIIMELDANPNPLRDELAGGALTLRDGCLALPEAPGIGWSPPIEVISKYTVEERVTS